MSDHVQVYIYPQELTPDDRLVDGPSDRSFGITEDTLLLWVDLDPEARFAHETMYVLISSSGTRVEDGEWWPVLNGKQILYGSPNSTAILSPFKLWKPQPAA